LADRAVELLPSSHDARSGPAFEETRARIQARFGDGDRAIPTLKHLLEIPYAGALTPALLRLHPDFDQLRSDPLFQKLCEEKQPWCCELLITLKHSWFTGVSSAIAAVKLGIAKFSIIFPLWDVLSRNRHGLKSVQTMHPALGDVGVCHPWRPSTPSGPELCCFASFAFSFQALLSSCPLTLGNA